MAREALIRLMNQYEELSVLGPDTERSPMLHALAQNKAQSDHAVDIICSPTNSCVTSSHSLHTLPPSFVQTQPSTVRICCHFDRKQLRWLLGRLNGLCSP